MPSVFLLSVALCFAAPSAKAMALFQQDPIPGAHCGRADAMVKLCATTTLRRYAELV